ncbi:MAG: DUF2163 domain-containing protein [Hyphomicrobium sp.]|nr:DUF2163 domain-containing protein [Hyphomicrobium sp.]
MRDIPVDLAAHLATGATSLCWCWRVTRRDGQVQGFTDHDRPLEFDATTFEAASGFETSEIRETLGLGTDNLELTGALSSAAITDDDLDAGLYDDAGIEIFRVNWAVPGQRVLVKAGTLGEVKRSGSVFTAEVRGVEHYLQQPKGRVYQYGCDADLGDERCGINLSLPVWRAEATVIDVIDDRRVTVSGLGSYATDHFTRGLATFTSGAADGQKIEIRRHTRRDGVVRLEFWQPVAGPHRIGATLVVTAGCDKQFATCRARFENAVNYRGFPHMPGNDFLAAVSRPGSKVR